MTHNAQQYEQVLLAYPYDGLVDVMVGLALAFGGVMLLIDLPWMAPILFIGIFFVLRSMRARWIMPRLTPDELDESTLPNQKATFLAGGLTALLVLGVFALALSNSDALDDIGDEGWLALAVGTLVFIIVGIAVLTGQRHWFVYAIITAILAGGIAAFGLPFELGVSMVGLPMTLYGLWMLIHFFSEHQLTSP